MTQHHVQKYVFPNGLRLVHEHIPGFLAVAYQVLVGVGSGFESLTQAGISHFTEHMLFQGTEERDSMAINQGIENLGGSVNAFTSFDHTGYYTVLPQHTWQHGLEIFLDMIFHPRFASEDIEIERQIILEELKEGEDALDTFFSEKCFEEIYREHPYGRPVIGNTKSVQNIDGESLKSFYQKWYSPANMVLASAGNVPFDQLVDAVKEATHDLPNNPISMSTPVVPEIQKRFSCYVLSKGTQERIVSISFPTPSVKHQDLASLDLLSVILSESELSRLHRKFRIQKKWVRSISTSLFSPLGEGQFMLHAYPYPNLEKKLIQGIFQELWDLVEQPISEFELNRAKSLHKRDRYFQRETAEGRARALAYYELTFGSFEEEQNYSRRIESLAVSDIQQAAEKYFIPPVSNVGLLAPKSEKSLSKDEIHEIADRFQKSSLHIIRPLSVPYQMWNVHDQVRVMFCQNQNTPISSLHALMKGGLLSEQSSINGVSSLIAISMNRGSKNRNEEQIASESILLQSEIEGLMGRNFQGLHMDVVGSNVREAIHLFSDVLLNPSFEKRVVDHEKDILLKELQSQKDHFELQASNFFLKTLYGDHPYGFNILGNEISLMDLDSEKTRQHYQSLLSSERVIIGAVGDINEKTLRRELENIFKDFHFNVSQKKIDSKVKKINTKKEVFFPIEGDKAYLNLGFLGAKYDQEDQRALDILSAVLTSSGGGRLYFRLREELGLVYSVDAIAISGIEPGYFMISLNTSPDRVDQVTEEIYREIAKLKHEPIPEEELQRVKNYFIGSAQIEFQRSSPKAVQLALGELFHTERTVNEYVANISKITSADVHQAANKYLDLDRSVFILLSPAVH